MKQVLLSFVVIATLISCNSKQDAGLKTDVAVLNPQPNTNDYSTDKTSEAEIPAAAPVTKRAVNTPDRRPVKVIYRDVPVKTSDTPPVSLPAPAPLPPVNPGNAGNDGSTNTTPSAPGNAQTKDEAGTTDIEPVVKKKGWNNAAKGAVIGGVVGAAGGAIISKKKGTGAIIGGVIGAAGGYVLGRAKDKKATSEFTY